MRRRGIGKKERLHRKSRRGNWSIREIWNLRNLIKNWSDKAALKRKVKKKNVGMLMMMMLVLQNSIVSKITHKPYMINSIISTLNMYRKMLHQVHIRSWRNLVGKNKYKIVKVSNYQNWAIKLKVIILMMMVMNHFRVVIKKRRKGRRFQLGCKQMNR